jgi:hypothetical protein
MEKRWTAMAVDEKQSRAQRKGRMYGVRLRRKVCEGYAPREEALTEVSTRWALTRLFKGILRRKVTEHR